jgi:antitoxin component YwqK of YwqJK toxin-antitoxin module
MRYFYLIILCLVFSMSLGQTQKAFITKDGNYSSSAMDAVSYILITKLAGDTAYVVNQYDLRDTIITSGIYKDDMLRIPNGKFTYYTKMRLRPGSFVLSGLVAVDTNNYISKVGYFLNGKREGIWRSYSAKGVMSEEYTYKDDKINGPYKQYYNDGSGYRAEGILVGDSLEGKFYIYNEDSLLIAESNYVHNREKSHTVHLVTAQPTEKFNDYLEKSLKKYKKQLIASPPAVKFTVGKTGEIKDFKIVKGVSTEVDGALLTAIATAPKWVPAIYDKLPSEQKISMELTLFQDRDHSNDTQVGRLPGVVTKYRLPGLVPVPGKMGVTYLQ